MSSVNKRIVRLTQRPRKKPPTHHPKLSTAPGSSSSEIGLFSSPHLTYQFARCFMGNVGEISTPTYDYVGVIKAVAPNGGFGMKFVRSAPRGSNDGPFRLDEDKVIPLSDIQKIIVRNVNSVEVQKEELVADESSFQLDDPDTCLQHFFTSNEDAEAFSLTSDEHFPPDQMFEVNKQKYNVTSSYRENLEGYTVPLDKTDPEFKAKEEYYAKVAKEIEDNKCLASAWESLADGEAENEELKFSAVLQDGVQGREFKNTFVRTNKKGGRGNNRASLPREYSEVHKSTETKSLKSNSAPLRDQNKSCSDSTPSKASSDTALEKVSPKPSSHESPTMDASENASASPEKDSLKPAESVGKREDKKKGFLDPDAPEFKPAGIIKPLESAGLAGATFNPAAYSQPMPLSVSGFAVSGQHPLPNGPTPAVQFNLPSSVPCVLSSAMASQFTTLRHPQINFSPQHLAMVSQQLSAPGSLSSQPSVAQSAVGSRGPRQSVPAGNYSKQRSIDQANTASQQLPFPIFPQGFPIVQAASYSIGVPLISPVTGNFHTTAYSGMHAFTGTVSASQASGQQSSATSHSTQPPSGQVNHLQPSSQAITSSSQVQGAQFHPGYSPHPGSVQGPAGIAAYPQYSTGQLIGSQAPPGSLGYYSQPVYQAPGLIPFPIQQVGAGGQPQIGSQLHNQGQQSLMPSQPLQLQAAQQPGTVQSVQQQPQPHLFFTAGPYQLSPQQMLAQAMTMGVAHQGVPNTFSIPQTVHPQPHPVQLYMPQQPNGTGSNL